MIINHLPRILFEKDVSIRELARVTGITYSTVYAAVKSDRRSIQLDVLDAFCAALSIQPGDIFAHEPDEDPTQN